MKKRFLSLVLTLALCLGLTISASAHNTAKLGERNIISAGSCTIAVVDHNGALWTWGGWDIRSGEPGDVVSVSCDAQNWSNDGYGNITTTKAIIREDNTLWTWGNYFLGNGTNNNSKVPVKVMDDVAAVSLGSASAAVIKTDRSLWAWGNNSFGQLGNGSTANCLIPVKVMDDVVAVDCGVNRTAAIKSDGSLWIWGSNFTGYSSGRLIDSIKDTTITRPVKVMGNVAAVSCGSNEVAIIKTDGSLWMWGSNSSGQLGDGTEESRTGPVKVLDDVVSVSCDSGCVHAVKADGTLLAWGSGLNGVLGNGSTDDSSSPVAIMYDVAAVDSGGAHVVAVKTDGTVWTWGSSYAGALGYQTSYKFSSAPNKLSQLTAPKPVRLRLNGGIGVGLLWCDKNGQVSPPANPTRPGYNFAGWYTDEGLTKLYNFNDKVTEGMTLYARWMPVSSSAETTEKSTQIIRINGNTITLDAYNLKADSNGGDVTYVKLRDIAALLDSTGSQFDVDWRNRTIYIDTGKPYSHRAGTELQAIQGTDGRYRWNTAPILFNGTTAPLEGIVITDGNGGDHTFFKLRDLGEAVGFKVGWSKELGIYIETE